MIPNNDSGRKPLVIRFWQGMPVGPDEMDRQNTDARHLIITFVCLWFFGVIFAGHLDEKWLAAARFLWIVPFILVPLFMRRSQATQLVCNQRELRLEVALAGSLTVVQTMPWLELSQVYVTKPRRNKRMLDQQICFQSHSGRILKVTMEQIATPEHWRELLKSIHAWSPRVATRDLDPDLFQSLISDSKNPTYTKLWLDSMLAPPRRSELHALKSGTKIKSGQYLLEQHLGGGGQGAVYLAKAPQAQTVVLKEYIMPLYVANSVRRKALADFEHEAALLRSLNHPGIVKIFDYFTEDQRAYLVLEQIKGQNLKEFVRDNGPIEEKKAIQLALHMCDILSYLHNAVPPIVHRDFTPDNLIIGSDGSIKLVDFAVAQEQTDAATPTVVGKPAYFPPEQFRGKATVQSDLYAFGCTLFYLLTAKDPVPLTCSHPISEGSPISAALDHIVATATELELENRYHTAQQVRQSLDALTS